MRTLTWMGTISCSLYLVHTIIGGEIVNVGGRLPQSPWNATLIIATACGASILLAWIFYLLIEGPSKLWASSIRYKKKENDSSIEMDKSTQRESGPHQKNQVLGRAA